MKFSSSFLLSVAFLALDASQAGAALIISQYVETNSGTIPKGIELWNTGPTIDFSTDTLVVSQGTNGGALSSLYTLSTGSIASGEVMVIGTSDMGAYLDTTFGDGSPGSSSVQFFEKGFIFNGDDSLSITVGTVTQDVFGNPGNDPGSAWSGSGVSTANQNIALLGTITTGDVDGWTDPSGRFTTVSTTPAATGGLVGFGVAPVPETSAALLGSLAMLGLLRRRR